MLLLPPSGDPIAMGLDDEPPSAVRDGIIGTGIGFCCGTTFGDLPELFAVLFEAGAWYELFAVLFEAGAW
jgi:hypothetical protein